MLINHNGSITRDISGDFLFSFFVDKAAKATHIDVVASGHVAFHNVEEGFYGSRNICLIDSGAVSNLVDDVSFSHK